MSQVQDREQPGAEPSSAETSNGQAGRGRLLWVSIISGLVAFLLFLSVPFLPVKQTEASFNWPQDNDVTSVTSPLMSYICLLYTSDAADDLQPV